MWNINNSPEDLQKYVEDWLYEKSYKPGVFEFIALTSADAEILKYLNNKLNDDPKSKQDINKITDLITTVINL